MSQLQHLQIALFGRNSYEGPMTGGLIFQSVSSGYEENVPRSKAQGRVVRTEKEGPMLEVRCKTELNYLRP